MKYVYLLHSRSNPAKTYIGLTDDLTRRLREHNEGSTRSTVEFRPWTIEVAIRFKNEKKEAEFEQYLKSGSGHAFAKRHFWGIQERRAI